MPEHLIAKDLAKLESLAVEITNCRRCDNQKIKVTHARGTMQRGSGRDLMVVGIQPGKNETATGTAFSGPAGKRLMGWLTTAGLGNNREEIFDRCYFTSLVKCGSSIKDLPSLFRNCSGFLNRQLGIVRPKVLITLGAEPLKYIFNIDRFEDWVCRIVTEQEIQPSFFPLLPKDSSVLALPHPSPLSRWINKKENLKRLNRSLADLKLSLEEQLNA